MGHLTVPSCVSYDSVVVTIKSGVPGSNNFSAIRHLISYLVARPLIKVSQTEDGLTPAVPRRRHVSTTDFTVNRQSRTLVRRSAPCARVE